MVAGAHALLVDLARWSRRTLALLAALCLFGIG